MKESAKISAPMRRKGGRPARADAQKLHHAILDAAEEIFMEQGFSGSAMDGIAAMAGTSKQTLYTRFGSKEKLFIAVSNRLLAPRFDSIAPKDRPLHEALYDVADQILAAMLDPKLVRMHSIIMADAVRFPDLAKLSDQDEHFPGRAALLTLLNRADGAQPLPNEEKHRLMLLLQDMILTAPLRAAALGLARPSKAELRRHARMAVDVFLGGLAATHAPRQGAAPDGAADIAPSAG